MAVLLYIFDCVKKKKGEGSACRYVDPSWCQNPQLRRAPAVRAPDQLGAGA